MQQVEEVLKRFPEVALAMTTIGTEEGRNYARINSKLLERKARARSQKDLEKAIRNALKPIPGIELSLGFNRPVWVNLLGPDPDTLSVLIREFAEKVGKIKGIADMETSEKAANPALSVRLNNDAASDLGITVQQVGATVRPLLAGDTVSYWLAPDGQNYEVNVQLPKNRRELASDLGNLYLTTNKRGPDGEMRMVPLRQVAEIVETTSPQIIKRQDLQRRVALYANAEGRPSGDVNADVAKIIEKTTLPPGYRFDVGGQAKDMQESFQAALAALGLAVIFIYLILASQFASFTQPVAIMASLPFSLIGVFLALLITGTTLNIFLDHRLHHADGTGHQERDPAGRLRQPRAARRSKPARCAAAGGPGSPAPDPDDHGGDDRRHAAAGARDRRRRRDAGADGPRDHRRRDHLDAADAGRRAGPLRISRPVVRAPCRPPCGATDGDPGGAGRLT